MILNPCRHFRYHKITLLVIYLFLDINHVLKSKYLRTVTAKEKIRSYVCDYFK